MSKLIDLAGKVAIVTGTFINADGGMKAGGQGLAAPAARRVNRSTSQAI